MSQNGSATTLIVAVILLLILGGGIFFLLGNQSQKPSLKPTVSSSQSVTSDVAWETRKIYLHRISANIPSNWSLNEAGSKECVIYQIISNDDHALLSLKPKCESDNSKVNTSKISSVLLKDYGLVEVGTTDKLPIQIQLFYGGPISEKSKYHEIADKIVDSLKRI